MGASQRRPLDRSSPMHKDRARATEGERDEGLACRAGARRCDAAAAGRDGRRLGAGAAGFARGRERVRPARPLPRLHARRPGAAQRPLLCGRRGPSSPCRRPTGSCSASPSGVADHGARARRPPSRDHDLRRPRDRRPGGDDPRRPDPARLPRLGPLAGRRLVRRPLLPPRRQRLHHLLRARRDRGSARPVRRAGDRRGHRPALAPGGPAGPRGAAADLPAGAAQRSRLRDLLRRPAERHRGQGDADEPRQPGLRGRDGDPARS